jgi:glutathione-independent formaldehyde dehydrogenase
MAGNKAVTYMGPGKVEIQTIDYPTLELRDGPGVNPANVGRKVPHGAILKNVATNICGSDQHMVRGRTTAPQGLVLGHEITGEVLEVGPGVEYIKVGDLCSVPFNISCGRCRNCKEGKTGICLNVNPDRPGSAYGYVDMGGWVGGQAEYVMVPYADWNLLRFPDKDQAMEKILDLAMLSDIFPTGYHGCVSAGVTTGSTVYIAGAGPVGLAAATSAFLLGAAVVIVGDLNKERLEKARGAVGIPGLYVTGDPGASDEAAREGSLSLRLGLGWARSHAFYTGQCPVMRYNRQLMMAILHDRVHVAANVDATAIPLDQAPEGYADFDQGAARKYVLDPHGMLGSRSN